MARPSDLRRGFDLAFGPLENTPVVADQRRLDREVDLISDYAIEGGGARLVQSVFESGGSRRGRRTSTSSRAATI
ncbi:hypothetical protein ACRAWD_10755 [Caulobacter segnis]